MTLEEAKVKAKKNSKEGYAQHVNYNVKTDEYYVSNWFNSDSTVDSYENGLKIS